MSLIVLHDIVDSSDSQGRTFKQINMARAHKYALNSLIELKNGARVFLARYARDCDGTPMYDVMPTTCMCVAELAFMQTDKYREYALRHPKRAAYYLDRDEAGHFHSCDHRLDNRFGPLVNHGEDSMTLIREPVEPSIAETAHASR